MNLVDSCGWLEYFADGPNARFFAEPLRDPQKLLVPTVCLLEVFKRVLAQRGESAALDAVANMHQGRVVSLDSAIALTAARISLAMRLPMADSIIMATARAFDAAIWTQDADFAELPGVHYRAT